MKTGGIVTPEDGAAAVAAVRGGVILGGRYTDIITRFTGVAIGHCEYLTGCHQTLLQPSNDDISVRPEAHWFDDQRLIRIGERVISLDNERTPGHDKPAPKR